MIVADNIINSGFDLFANFEILELISIIDKFLLTPFRFLEHLIVIVNYSSQKFTVRISKSEVQKFRNVHIIGRTFWL